MIKRKYDDLLNVKIPAVVYTGDESTLPAIFDRINSKGEALTEYEIYAASWPSDKFKVGNEKIIEKVLEKYDCLNDDDYEFTCYDRDAMRINKELNSFEYTFGLSKYLQEKYDELGFNRKKPADETNPLAFQLINACFNNSYSEIKNCYKIILKFSNNINKLEECLIDSINFVVECIKPICRFKGNKRNNSKIWHSQWQILSLIAFAFKKKYDSDLNENQNWKSAINILKETIWKYYVYDILCKYWADGGTNKIHKANNEDRYFKEITFTQFDTVYNEFSENEISRHEVSQVSSPSEKDYVVLNTIYLNEFTAMDQLSLDKFDVEHIATKKQMKLLIEKVKIKDGLPISHIANLCYLPESVNRSKKWANFYQDIGYLKELNLLLSNDIEGKLKYIENKYSYTTREELEWMNYPYKIDDADLLKESYLDFLKNRNKKIKRKFMLALGYKIDK